MVVRRRVRLGTEAAVRNANRTFPRVLCVEEHHAHRRTHPRTQPHVKKPVVAHAVPEACEHRRIDVALEGAGGLLGVGPVDWNPPPNEPGVQGRRECQYGNLAPPVFSLRKSIRHECLGSFKGTTQRSTDGKQAGRGVCQ